MDQVLLVVQVLIGMALVGIILIQRSETDGFGLGSGSGANLLSGRGAANLLTRTTAILATLFIINSLALSIIAARSGPDSVIEQIKEQEAQTAPIIPTVPAADASKAPAAAATTPKPTEKKLTSDKKEAPVVPAAQ